METQTLSRLHIRWMVNRDLPDVVNLDVAEWTAEDFTNTLRNKHKVGLVIEENDAVAGFIVYQLHKKYLHIQNIAWTNPRVLIALLTKMQQKLCSHRRTRLIWYVNEYSNPAFLDLVAKQGFASIYSRKAEAIKFTFTLTDEAPIEAELVQMD